MRTFSFLGCLSFFLSALLAPLASAADSAKQVSLDLLRDPEVVALARSIPVQEAGRIKPLDTVAYFRLLRFSGKTTIPMVGADGKKTTLNDMEWLLVSWFRPDVAKDLPVFVVDNSDAIVQIGLKAKEKRDRYSYNELLPGREALLNERSRLKRLLQLKEDNKPGGMDFKDFTPVERDLYKLGTDFLDDEMLLGYFNFARAPFGEDLKIVPVEILPNHAPAPHLAPVLKNMTAYFKAHPESAAPMANPWLGNLIRAMLDGLMNGSPEQTLRTFPPDSKEGEIWQGPGTLLSDVINSALGGASPTGPNEPAAKEYTLSASNEAWLDKYEDLFHAATDPAAFKTKLKAYHDDVVKAADALGQGSHVNLEVSYNEAGYFYNALYWFFAGLILLALSWTAPKAAWGRWCTRLSVLTMLVGLCYSVTGIVVRCIIMQRPPITTLYETILFISTAGVILGLIAEALTRKNIGLAVACLAGTAGMFLSIRYMDMEGTDTLQQLQAVLITNFWLATHVPTINLGYAAGMVAAILSMCYFVMRLFRQIQPGTPESRDFTRIGYGFVMAGLFLSLVGTILGGIWANYSWGRFWGWDPKENGALMIVLMNLTILHARMGGYVKEVGFHCLNIILGMVVAFSWFGVNQLGVGLHAYGFTNGVWFWLIAFWCLMLVFLAYGIFLSFYDRRAKRRIKEQLPAGQPAAI